MLYLYCRHPMLLYFLTCSVSGCVYVCVPTPQATEALRITAPELVKFGVMDTVIPEPLGGAHADPLAAFPRIKEAILNTYKE